MNTQTHYLEKELRRLIQNDPRIFGFFQKGSLDGIWYRDLEKPENEWMSPEFWITLGYDPAEKKHLAAEWQSLLHPDDLRAALISFDKHCADPEHPYDQIVRYRHKDGSTVWVRCRGIAIRDEAGQPVRMLGTHSDITDQKRAEDALRQSEEQYRTVVETISEGIILQESSGKILTWNKGAEKVFGISAETVIGVTSEDGPWRTIREDGSPYEGRDHPSMRTLRTGQPCRDELMGVYQPSGALRWISINTNPLFHERQEKPYAVVISFVDVTQRKLAEDRLHRSREELKRTLEATTDGIWTWSFKTGQLEFSPRYYTMLGYEPYAFPANLDAWVNLIHPDDREKALAVADAYLQTKPDTYENEFRLRTASGHYRWIRTRARAVERGQNGEPVLMIGNHEDITEKIKAIEEKEVMLSNYKRKAIEMEALFKGSRLLLEEKGFAETSRNIFDLCRELTGAKSGYVGLLRDDGEDHEVVFLESGGLSCSVDPELPMPVRGLRAEAYKSGQPVFENDYANSRWMKYVPAGHVRLHNAMFVPLKEKGLTIGLIGLANKDQSFTDEDAQIVQSMSELAAVSLKQSKIREALEKRENQLRQSQKMESIGTLAGGIAHDFNNLLYPIIGYAEMLMDDLGPDNPLLGEAKNIYKSALRASDLVRQILTFSRQSPVELKPVRIQSAVADVMNLIRHSLPSTIRIEKAIDETCDPITADEGQLHQVIMNLVTNAYQAMAETGGEIELRLEQVFWGETEALASSLPSGEYACFSVADTGPGIREDLLGRIFDPYFTTREKGKGTGLGLAITHSIIKSYGGTINVSSQPGRGALFEVYLPVIKIDFRPTPTTVAPNNLYGLQEHILFVDDESDIGNIVNQMLARLNYRVTMRTSSIEALDLFRQQPDGFDLIITDMTMPYLTGIELTKAIQDIRPDIPIILCTGFSEQIDDLRARQLGIRDLIMKPIVRDQLAAAIRRALDDSQIPQ